MHDNLDDSLPITVAQMVGQFMESIFYGIYLMTFVMCARVLLSRRSGNKVRINRYLAVAALCMFVVGTIDLASGIYHNVLSFIYSPVGAKKEFMDISEWANVIKVGDYVAQTFVGDGILLYRYHVIWDRKLYLVLPPLAIWLAGTVCGTIATYKTATLRRSAFEDDGNIKPYIDAMTCLTLAFNVITTSLIVYRIWHTKRQTASLTSYRLSPLDKISRIIIESGLLYTLSVTVVFILYVLENNGQYIVTACTTQIIGIVFNLIIIRMDSEFTKSIEFDTDFDLRMGSNPSDVHRFSLHRLHASKTSASGGRPVELDLTVSKPTFGNRADERNSDVEVDVYEDDVRGGSRLPGVGSGSIMKQTIGQEV